MKKNLLKKLANASYTNNELDNDKVNKFFHDLINPDFQNKRAK